MPLLNNIIWYAFAMKICKIKGCGRDIYGKQDWCYKHYKRVWRTGSTNRVRREDGTGCFRKDGYQIIYKHDKNQLVHRLMMEEHIGRKLTRKEVVHHIDGNPSNNVITNLQLCASHADHNSIEKEKRALEIFGNKTARPCWICGKHDLPKNLERIDKSPQHPGCRRKYQREGNARRKEALCRS